MADTSRNPSASGHAIVGQGPRSGGHGPGGKTRADETVGAEGLCQLLALVGTDAGQDHRVGPAHGAQGFSEASLRRQTATAEGVGNREGENVQIALEGEMGKAVIEKKQIRWRLELLKSVSAGFETALTDQDVALREHAGQQHRLIADDLGIHLGAPAHQADALASGTVAAGQDCRPQALPVQMFGDRRHQRSLAAPTPMQIPNADHRPAQLARQPVV